MNLSVELGTIITSAVCIVFWLAGLSFSAKQSRTDIKNLWEKHDDLGSELRKSLSTIGNALSRIEGHLFGKREDK